MRFIENVYNKAVSEKKTIVLAEGFEMRTLKAAQEAVDEGIADIILLGNESDLSRKIPRKYRAKFHIINPENSAKTDSYIEEYARLRSKKGITSGQAAEIMKNPLYFGAMMVRMCDADGMVAGADNSSAEVLRAALQIVKASPDVPIVSSCFIMNFSGHPLMEDGVLIYADCVINVNPNAQQLANIAVATAKTASELAEIEPRVALLSFSTKGSAKNECIDKVVEAVEIAKRLSPNLLLDGEMQFDAAIIEHIGKFKCPGSLVAGRANVLVFPDLQSGNIGYKITERLGGATAIGPVSQGLNKPINDLSRGCSAEDIVNAIAITAVQAQYIKNNANVTNKNEYYEGSKVC